MLSQNGMPFTLILTDHPVKFGINVALLGLRMWPSRGMPVRNIHALASAAQKEGSDIYTCPWYSFIPHMIRK